MEDRVMDNKSKNPNLSGAQLPDISRLKSPAEQDNDADVARVLEHVSSPFRWELLEVPQALPISSAPDKFHQQKLNSRR
jgi:hypothetical protein